ncbi:MAG: hypothetical protein ACC656_02920 [Candidatus Heimdallarchaeota archaeon]
MIYNYQGTNLIGTRSFRINRFIYLLGFILTPIIIISEVFSKQGVSIFTSSFQSGEYFYPILDYLEMFLFSLFVSGLVLIISIPFGLFTKYSPLPINEIIKSQFFHIQIRKDHFLETEICVIDLKGAIIEVSWEKCKGSYHHWKLEIALLINQKEIKNKLQYDQLAKMLIMEKEDEESLDYYKVILVREWPRQEYLIRYWLKNLLPNKY